MLYAQINSKEKYNKVILLNSLEKSIHQAKLQNSQELDEISLDDLEFLKQELLQNPKNVTIKV